MIEFTQGDALTVSMTVQDGNGNLIDLTGATFSTQILGNAPGTVVILPNSQHAANPDQINFRGQFTLSFLTTDTAGCGIGQGKEILTQVVISGEPVTYRGVGILTVLAAVPTQ